MIGPSGFMQAPKELNEEKSIAFKAGEGAAESGIPILKSALKNLHPMSQQYEDFIAGYNSVKNRSKASKS